MSADSFRLQLLAAMFFAVMAGMLAARLYVLTGDEFYLLPLALSVVGAGVASARLIAEWRRG